MSLGSWEITIPQTFKKDESTSEVLNLSALSHPREYIEVSCSLWPSQADVAWYYWSLGLLSFAVNLFCKTRLLLIPHWVKMLCVSEFSSPFLQALVLAEVPFTPDVFSLIFSHSHYLCVFVRPGKLRAVLQDLQSTREMQMAATAELLCAHAHGSSGILQQTNPSTYIIYKTHLHTPAAVSGCTN